MFKNYFIPIRSMWKNRLHTFINITGKNPFAHNHIYLLNNDFTTPLQWYVQPQLNAYTNPVILLTTRWTTSAGETLPGL